MRVKSAIICEKVAKLVSGRSIAYGVFSGVVHVTQAERGRVMTLGALIHLSFPSAGSYDVGVRVRLPDGEVREMPALRVQSDGVGLVEVILDNCPVPLTCQGAVFVEVRNGAGLWKEAARLVTTMEAPQVAVAPPDAAALLKDVSGVPN